MRLAIMGPAYIYNLIKRPPPPQLALIMSRFPVTIIAVGAVAALGAIAVSSFAKDNRKARLFAANQVGIPTADDAGTGDNKLEIEDRPEFEYDFVIVGGGTAAMV